MSPALTFTERVLQVVAAIPHGKTLSYKEVAQRAGSAGAVRAVGSIMNRNRNPKVPCHRVIKSDGSIGGFAFGASRKIKKLQEEGFLPAGDYVQAAGAPEAGARAAAKVPKIGYKVLPQSFFDRPAVIVAEELLGKIIVRKIGGRKIEMMINEVEAYDGPQDLACHASKGRTARTEVMFGPAGNFYVYFCYGVHWMLNIVTGPASYPAAVLIRGAGQANGPGRLTKELKIGGELNGKKALPKNGLWLEDNGVTIKKSNIKRTARIGVNYAGPVWSKKPYRFLLVRT